mmetsp:Transcript_13762/g.20856  ORF Transcript_13762/g.20856 Transcript_13762/m.20856 type:complete len:202 (+) Transcript_13762:28-633(+)
MKEVIKDEDLKRKPKEDKREDEEFSSDTEELDLQKPISPTQPYQVFDSNNKMKIDDDDDDNTEVCDLKDPFKEENDQIKNVLNSTRIYIKCNDSNIYSEMEHIAKLLGAEIVLEVKYSTHTVCYTGDDPEVYKRALSNHRNVTSYKVIIPKTNNLKIYDQLAMEYKEVKFVSHDWLLACKGRKKMLSEKAFDLTSPTFQFI